MDLDCEYVMWYCVDLDCKDIACVQSPISAVMGRSELYKQISRAVIS